MSDEAIAVLLVEDNLADVALLMELLQDSEAESWQVTHVKRLSLALEHLHQTEFDVILLDLSLPDSQGLDTVARLQATVPHLPIVVLTGLEDKTVARQAVAQGAQDYLVKGQLSAEMLLKTVNYAIERTHILRRLQESEHRFRAIFNQTFQFMGLLSPEGVVLDINQVTREVIDFPNEAIINKLIWEAPCWQPEQSQSWLKQAVLRAAQGEVLRSELQACTAKGSLWWLDISIKPLRNENGSITLLIVEGREISKLKRAEAEIRCSLEKEREVNQMKNGFISMLSHEFRNPISSISYAIDFLKDCDPIGKQKEQCFEQMGNSIDQALHLLDEILLLGRTESGRIEVDYTVIQLKEFCSEIVQVFQLTQGKSHQIVFSIEGDDSTQARMDGSLVKHILDNLLSNSIKYSPKGSMIRFTLVCQDNQAKFCIQDRGIGIPAKDRSKLFEPFHRAGNVCNIQGTGLGLAIVKRCVDLQNGQIHVESQEGTGTTFTVILPFK
ncbi:response regulator [Phormidium sp. LEGE 05292]|uniref:sensor histidine kinase n=1 Tax=[Phormidium] sp. LEGE 05292 TaxID=767427 RepID=UPI00188232C2|nr:ATP-binding protein [Phormidium sp. LEGE 05292]MBE9229581.1 response regulator [Phormidium sp. LEGE 05292]